MHGLMFLFTFIILSVMVFHKNNWLAQERDIYRVLVKHPYLEREFVYDTWNNFE